MIISTYPSLGPPSVESNLYIYIYMSFCAYIQLTIYYVEYLSTNILR